MLDIDAAKGSSKHISTDPAGLHESTCWDGPVGRLPQHHHHQSTVGGVSISDGERGERRRTTWQLEREGV